MSSIYYILKEKVPIKCNIDIWSEWMKNSEKERIVKETIIGEKLVSTVFLGIDHNFSLSKTNSPILFETLIFNKKYNVYEHFQERYSTYDAALEGHNYAIKKIKASLREQISACLSILFELLSTSL